MRTYSEVISAQERYQREEAKMFVILEKETRPNLPTGEWFTVS